MRQRGTRVAAGLGEELLTELQATMATIVASPRRFRVVYRTARRAPLRRFPYAILYRVQRADIVVVAFFHGSRNPRTWRSRR